jgi:hypothetical protein
LLVSVDRKNIVVVIKCNRCTDMEKEYRWNQNRNIAGLDAESNSENICPCVPCLKNYVASTQQTTDAGLGSVNLPFCELKKRRNQVTVTYDEINQRIARPGSKQHRKLISGARADLQSCRT